ncbi:uncharacterized protein LOC144352623 [Saccoglossus kowalevskii]
MEQGYQRASKLLDEEYGNPYIIAQAYAKEAERWPEIKTEDKAALKNFAIFLMKCDNAIAGQAHLEELNHHTNLKMLVSKHKESKVVSNAVFGDLNTTPKGDGTPRYSKKSNSKAKNKAKFACDNFSPSWVYQWCSGGRKSDVLCNPYKECRYVTVAAIQIMGERCHLVEFFGILEKYGNLRNLEEAAKRGEIDAIRVVRDGFSEGYMPFNKDTIKAAYWSGKHYEITAQAIESENSIRAFHLYRSAAELAQAGAQLHVASFYRIGIPGALEKNLDEAVKWNRMAAGEHQLNTIQNTCVVLGEVYTKIKYWLHARFNLWEMFSKTENPTGKVDPVQAIDHLQIAAEGGLQRAEREYGKVFLYGRLGFSTNKNIAKWWLLKAGEKGDSEACTLLNKISEDEKVGSKKHDTASNAMEAKPNESPCEQIDKISEDEKVGSKKHDTASNAMEAKPNESPCEQIDKISEDEKVGSKKHDTASNAMEAKPNESPCEQIDSTSFHDFDDMFERFHSPNKDKLLSLLKTDGRRYFKVMEGLERPSISSMNFKRPVKFDNSMFLPYIELPIARRYLESLKHFKEGLQLLSEGNMELATQTDGIHHLAKGNLTEQVVFQSMTIDYEKLCTISKNILSHNPADLLTRYFYVSRLLSYQLRCCTEYVCTAYKIREYESLINDIKEKYSTEFCASKILYNLYFELGGIYAVTDQSQRSVDAFEKASDMDEDTMNEALLLLAFKKQESDSDTSITLFKRYLKKTSPLERKYPNAHYHLACLFGVRDDLKLAFYHYEQGVQAERLRLPFIEPQNIDVKKTLQATYHIFDCHICSDPECTTPDSDDLKHCACRLVRYCSQVCQKKHFKKHKKVCTARKKKT